MIITKNIEPDTSEKNLKLFEQKYGYDSRYFYTYFQLGINLIGNDREAIDWAFEYEINILAKQEFSEPRSVGQDNRSSQAPVFLAFFPREDCQCNVTPINIFII